MSFRCDRCDQTFTIRYNLIRHLENKNVCNAKTPERDIDPLLLASRYKIRQYTDQNPVCPHCNKSFKTEELLRRHCQLKHKPTETPTASASHTDAMMDEIKQLKEQIQLLVEQQKSAVPNIVVNNNCTFTTNNTLNAFGKENIDYLRESPGYNNFMQQCIKNKAYGLCNYLLARNFHKDHPENHNLAKRVKKDPFIHVFDGEEWKPKMVQDALEQLFAKMEREFAVFADNIDFPTQGLTKRQMDAFMKEVGLPLEWDLSCEKYEYDPDMITEEQKETIKKRLFTLVLEYIIQYSNKRDVQIR